MRREPKTRCDLYSRSSSAGFNQPNTTTKKLTVKKKRKELRKTQAKKKRKRKLRRLKISEPSASSFKLKSSVKSKLQKPPKLLVLNVPHSRLRKMKKPKLKLLNRPLKMKPILPRSQPRKSPILQSKMISISMISERKSKKTWSKMKIK